MTAHRPIVPIARIWAGVVLLLGGFVLFHWFGNPTRGYIDSPSLFTWWASQWFNPAAETEHGPLILIVSVALVLRNWIKSPQEPTEPRILTGTLICSGALALHGLGYLVQQNRISIIALLLYLWGCAWLCGGRRLAKASGFPLAFMVFALPMKVLMDEVGFHLRLNVIHVTTWISHLIGIPVVQTGTQLSSPDGSYVYDVAPACSGVRSLAALAAASLLLGYLLFKSWWRRGLMLALALPFTFLGNLVRILAIVIAAEYFGEEWGARVHEWFGFLTFVIVLGLALLTAELLRKYLPEKPEEASIHPPEPAKNLPSRGLVVATGIVTGLSVCVALLTMRLEMQPRLQGAGIRMVEEQPAPLPNTLGYEWLGRPVAVSDIERQVLPPDTGFSRKLYVGENGEQVLLSIVLTGKDRSSIHRPQQCLPGQGWEIKTTRSGQLDLKHLGSLPVTRLKIEGRTRDNAVVSALFVYWFVSEERIASTNLQRMARDVQDRLKGKAPRWAYVTVQTQMPDGEEAAFERIENIVGRALPSFQVTPLEKVQQP